MYDDFGSAMRAAENGKWIVRSGTGDNATYSIQDTKPDTVGDGIWEKVGDVGSGFGRPDPNNPKIEPPF